MTEMVTDEVLNQRYQIAAIVMMLLIVTVVLMVVVYKAAVKKLNQLIAEKDSMIEPITAALSKDVKAGLNISLSVDDVRTSAERITYTEQLLRLIETIIQRSTAFQLYKQLGKLPLDKFSAAMQSNIISAVASEVNAAIDTERLVQLSVVSQEYVDAYIVNATIVAVDATLAKMIDTDAGDERLVNIGRIAEKIGAAADIPRR